MVSRESRILIMDEDDNFRALVSNVFQKRGWLVHTTTDGNNAIRLVNEFNPDIILMDMELPGRDGITICRIIRRDLSLSHHYPILLMSSSPNKKQIVKAIEAGCDDFVLKPIKFDLLIKKVEKLIEFQQIKKIVKEKGREKEEEKIDYQEEEREAEVITYSREVIKKVFSNAMHGKIIPYPVVKNVTKKMVKILHKEHNLPMAFKMKSYYDYTYIHSINVASLSMSFAYHLKWGNDDLKILGEGGFLHDIGMTKMDIQIITKPDKLSESELIEIKKHPEFSKEILAKQNVANDTQRIALEHHEQIDGNGYPQKLSNEQISKFARLVSIVDVYDALTTDRSYNKSVDSDEAIKIMSSSPGKFDPDLFTEFKNLVSRETIGK